MKRWVAGCAAVLVWCSASLRADVTITQTITMEGQAVAAMGQSIAPHVVMRIKGTKARTEVEASGKVTITLTDQASGRITILNPADKTARVIEPASADSAAPANAPKPDITIKPTGQTRTIDGAQCDEYALAMSLNVADMVGPGMQMPPEAAAALKGVRMIVNGTTCIATQGPGMAEYMAYQKNAAATLRASMVAGLPTMNAGTLEQVMNAASEVPGLAYISEMNISMEGSGQFAALMQQLGTMKVTNKTVSVSVDPIPDDLFTVPQDYKIIK